MTQLNALSGYSFPERDQKKKGRQNPMFHTGDFNLHDSQTNVPCHAKRKKVGDGSGKRVRELVLVIANLPGMLDSNIGPRFPEWYIQDWMRYDLEALGVERLTVLAPSKGDFAANSFSFFSHPYLRSKYNCVDAVFGQQQLPPISSMRPYQTMKQ